MRWILPRCLAVIPIALVIGAASASAASIPHVTFDYDVVDPALDAMNVPDGFTSTDSALVHFFSETGSGALVVLRDDVATASSPGQESWGLAVFDLYPLGDPEDDALLIEFDFVATAISMRIGNDDPDYVETGDAAVLTAFLDGLQVGQVSLELNGDSWMNQEIAFEGAAFNSATLKYDVAGRLTEVVDDVRVTPIPEPHAGVAFVAGVLLVGTACRRRWRAEVGLGARRR